MLITLWLRMGALLLKTLVLLVLIALLGWALSSAWSI
ncbi:Catalase [Pseudomonas chlororaphis subsp. aurantiaca]|nr:Catalase [Pseudomonas chlororaphis subsp. aurantiaca]